MVFAASVSASGLSWKLLAALACLFLAILLAVLLFTGALDRDDPGQRLAYQLDRHYSASGRHGGRGAVVSSDGRAAAAAVSSAAGLLGSSLEQRLAVRLELASVARKPGEWVVLGTAASAVLAVFFTVGTGNPLLGVPAGALAGYAMMRFLLNWLIGRRRRAFADQLPQALQLIAGSLQSGFSLPQALDAVVRDDTQPLAGEFNRALAEVRLGGELEDALERVADRMDSMDLRWSIMAIRIQRSVGGNLVEVLRNTVALMRDRSAIRRHARALSAEGRLSAYVLIGLPIVIGGWLFATSGSYMHPLVSTPIGLVMLIAGAVLMVVGSFWMRNVVKVEF
jgi:Flp pilus assembly protein TadB